MSGPEFPDDPLWVKAKLERELIEAALDMTTKFDSYGNASAYFKARNKVVKLGRQLAALRETNDDGRCRGNNG